MNFQYSCVHCPDVEELEFIIEHSQEIEHDAFREAIGPDNYYNLSERLGYYSSYDLSLGTDWAVRFHQSQTPDGRIAYYVVHSATEYMYY